MVIVHVLLDENGGLWKEKSSFFRPIEWERWDWWLRFKQCEFNCKNLIVLVFDMFLTITKSGLEKCQLINLNRVIPYMSVTSTSQMFLLA